MGDFTGLRAAELSRLDYLERRTIELRSGQAKTKTPSSRIMAISKNLAALLVLVEREGKVIPDKTLFRQATALVRKQGLSWPRNVLPQLTFVKPTMRRSSV